MAALACPVTISLCLPNGELPQDSLFFLSCYSRLVSIELSALYLYNKQPNSLPKYSIHFCRVARQSHLRFLLLYFLPSLNEYCFICNVSLQSKHCFWLLLNTACSRLLKREASWQLNHKHEEQIAQGEIDDTFQPVGARLS